MIDLKHMDVGSRNARLRETLESFGLFVTPIYREDRPDEIDLLHVSVARPTYARENGGYNSTSGAISEPVPCSNVIESVSAAAGGGGNVIDFPSIER
jgi:hypothetical protein